jgi:hypothetical protein
VARSFVSVRSERRLLGGLVALAIALVPSIASANPRPLPFTYGTETLPKGESELEQFVDVTPVRALSTTNGEKAWYVASQFQTEFETGLTDRLELGLYVSYVPHPGDTFTATARMPEGNGLKQRLRYVLAPPGELPIDIGLYGELVENEREIELEAKILLQRRFGRLRVVTNLWAEYELYYAGERDIVLNPTLGMTYEVDPKVHLGLESWMRVEFPHPTPAKRPFGLGPHVYAGPTMMFNFDRIWWSVGLYVRATDANHTMEPGEAFGRFWARSIIGINL